MLFNRIGGKIINVKFTKLEQEALDKAIYKQVVQNDRKFEIDRDSTFLWMLHQEFKFGKKNLYRAWKSLVPRVEELRNYYEMTPQDDGWLCRQKLKAIGVDVERWYADEGHN